MNRSFRPSFRHAVQCGTMLASSFWMVACQTSNPGESSSTDAVSQVSSAAGGATAPLGFGPLPNKRSSERSPRDEHRRTTARDAQETPTEKPAFLLLRDGTVHASAPAGLHVAGTQGPDGYYPTASFIDGEGQMGPAEGTPGWFELLDLRFYPAMTGRPPAAPYIEGTKSTAGFIPMSRRIHY